MFPALTGRKTHTGPFTAVSCLSLALFLLSCQQNKRSPSSLHNSENGDTALTGALISKAISFEQTDFDSVYHYGNLALEQAVRSGYTKGAAKARAVLANYLRRKGRYPEAIAEGLAVVHLYDSMRMVPEAVSLRNVIADTYKEMGGEKGTMEFLNKGLDMARLSERESVQYKYPAGIVQSLNIQGIILRDMSRRSSRKDLMDTALQLYTRALRIIDSSGSGKETEGKLYNNISQVYNEHYKDYNRALAYLYKAVQYNSERKNLNSLTFNYGNLSDVYSRTGNLEKAMYYARLMMNAAQELRAPHRIVNALNQLTRVYKKSGQYDSALYYKEWYISMADSLNNLEKTGQIAEMQTRYEAGKKDAQIERLAELNAARNQRFWVLAVASLVLAGLLAMVWIQKRKSQKQQALISQQADRLQWMMKELHHRVKNNLQIVSSLLNLQGYRVRDEQGSAALRESQLRVQAMSLMHQRLYQVDDVSLINFRLYLTDLAETLMKAYGYNPDDFDLDIQVEQEMLDVDTVMPLGLLVNEIMTNAFKYAYKNLARPSLQIRLTGREQQLDLTVADNGPGIPAGIPAGGGFGQQLIQALTKQLKGSYTLENTNGARYHFSIPYQQKAA